MRRISQILAAGCCMLAIAGCANDPVHRSYPAHSVGSALNVHDGEIITISTINVEGRHDQLGTLGGGSVGYSVGRSVGSGTAARVAGAAGAVGGAIVGRAIQRKATEQTAYQVIVELDTGRVVAIVQTELDDLGEGAPVRVLMGRSNNRVVPR